MDSYKKGEQEKEDIIQSINTILLEAMEVEEGHSPRGKGKRTLGRNEAREFLVQHKWLIQGLCTTDKRKHAM